jgi:hypothetical protein
MEGYTKNFNSHNEDVYKAGENCSMVRRVESTMAFGMGKFEKHYNKFCQRVGLY